MSDVPYYIARPGYTQFGAGVDTSNGTGAMLTRPADGSSGSVWSGIGMFASIAGTMLSAVGSYYAAQSQKSQLKSQALSAEFASSMARMDASRAEEDANAILEAGQREAAALTLQQGQERAGVQVSQAVSGTVTGAGSNAEVLASQRLIQRIDAMTVDSNALRAAAGARTRATNSRTEAAMLGVSARNLRTSAGSINPAMGAAASLLGGASTVSQQFMWRYGRRY